MDTNTEHLNKVYFSFNKIKGLPLLLFGSISIGIIMSIFKDYNTYGWGVLTYVDVLFLAVTALFLVLYFLRALKLTTALFIIAYFILAGLTLVLPLLLRTDNFNFLSYYLEIQFLIMLFGLILTIGVKPYHDLILGAFNILFSIVCLVFIPEFPLEVCLFYLVIVTAKCIICYVIFKRMLQLRRQVKEYNETIISQNIELLELTTFRKDIMRIVAHDLRNPIHQISGLIDLFQHCNAKEEQSEIIELLHSSVKNSYTMLEDLLEWSMQSNKDLKGYSMINVEDLIATIENQLKSQIKKKQLTIVKNIRPKSEIFYSKNVIESVMRNLLVNAVKFSPNNNEISVTFKDSSTSFSIDVTNISETTELENISNYNEEGVNLKSTIGTQNEPGSGNGLKVCKELMRKNNGSLSLRVQNHNVYATVLVNKVL